MLAPCSVSGASEFQYAEEERSKYVPGSAETRNTSAIRSLRRDKGKTLLADKIMKMLVRYPCSPIENICDVKEWIFDDDLQYIRASNRIYLDVLDTFQKRICTFNLKDYVSFYNDEECFPKFSSGPSAFNDIYFDIPTSITVIEKLLNHQFGEDKVQIDYFLRTLYNVLERRIPKMNSIALIGPKSSGKSYFIDMICNYFLNVGRMGTLNRYNGFNLMDTAGKRLIVWDEPNYERAKLEDLKKILGGGEHKVSVKFKADQAVYRTPVIITTNNYIPLLGDPNFEDRVRSFNWTSASFLKEYTHLPNPLTTIELFKHYNIVDEYYDFIE